MALPSKCAGIVKATGKTCPKSALPGSLYCFGHDPEKKEQHAAAGKAGADFARDTTNDAAYRYRSLDAKTTRKKKIQSAARLREFVRDLIYWTITGKLDWRLAQTAIQGCNLILASFSKVDSELKLSKLEARVQELSDALDAAIKAHV